MQRLHNPRQRRRREQEDRITSSANVSCFVLFHLINPLEWTHECEQVVQLQTEEQSL